MKVYFFNDTYYIPPVKSPDESELTICMNNNRIGLSRFKQPYPFKDGKKVKTVPSVYIRKLIENIFTLNHKLLFIATKRIYEHL